ncbi:MAG: AAA family ATPase [Anaeromyxobacter sp. RBG_16_69_14]|nr:MAG: AAA family ATPase [Anaeromyxobacter sp. RBG_16_69_14]
MAGDFVEKLAELHRTGARIIYVVTDEEERAVALCRTALEGHGRGDGPAVAIWSRTRGLDPVDPMARSGGAALEALFRGGERPLVGVLLDFHLELEDRAVARRLRDLLPSFYPQRRCVVVIAPRLRLPEGLTGEATVLRLPLPDHDELAHVLASMLPPGGRAGEAAVHAAIIAAAGLTYTQAQRAFNRALHVDPALGPAAVAAVLDEKQRLLARDRGLELVEVKERPEDLGGLDTFKTWIRERALAFAPDARKFGLPAPRGVMLLGVQGCGKSLAAKAVAGLLGVPLLRLELARVLGAGDGAEEGLARALESAEAIAPVALWVDEIEKGFAGSAPGQGGDARAARLLGSFSTWLQERRGSVFVVATANDVTRLPPELLRRGRFDELFFVDLPDLEARRAILGLHLAKRGRDPERFELAAVAEQCGDYSGAELEQVVVGALHRAYALGRELEPQDLRRLAQDLVPLYRTYEEQIKALREWARGRARTAGREAAVVDLFRKAGDAPPAR